VKTMPSAVPHFTRTTPTKGCRIVHRQHDHRALMAERLGRSHRSRRNARTPALLGTRETAGVRHHRNSKTAYL
jgi:hypothetical protein